MKSYREAGIEATLETLSSAMQILHSIRSDHSSGDKRISKDTDSRVRMALENLDLVARNFRAIMAES